MASRRLQVSVTRAELYVDPNPSRYGKRKHTKVSINTMRHLDSDSTTDRAAHFTWPQASEAIAKLVVYASTSTGEYQVPCRVDGVFITRQESIPKLVATTFRCDPVGTDYDLAPCQPGFVNSTYNSWCLIIVKCLGDSTSNPGRFQLDIVAENAQLCPVQFQPDSVPKGASMPTRSWWDLANKSPTQKGTEKRVPMLALRRSHVPRPLSLSRPGRQCRNRSQYVASRLSRRMTLLRNLRFAMPSEFRLHLAPVGHARSDSGRGSYCLGNIASALRSEDEANLPCMAALIQSGPLTFYGGGDGMAPPFDFVLEQARCFAPEEGWTRHPQTGNCGVPDGASMFTQVNFRSINKFGHSLDEHGSGR